MNPSYEVVQRHFRLLSARNRLILSVSPMQIRVAWRALIAVLSAVGVAASAQQSQQPPKSPQPTFRSSVQLVRVDAVVVDADGRPVTGLGSEDFEVLDNGCPQRVSLFREMSHEAAAASSFLPHDVGSNVSTDTGRLVVLLFDDLHIRKEWADRGRELAKEFVLNVGADATMALLSTSGKYQVDFTDDRTKILAALDGLSGRENRIALMMPAGSCGNPPHPNEPQRPEMIAPGEAEFRNLNHVPVPVTTQPCSPTSYFRHIGNELDSSTLFQQLETAARLLASEDARHKAFVWISDGLPFGTGGIAPTGHNGENNTKAYFDAAIDAMHQSGVVTYAIDPVGTGHLTPDSPVPVDILTREKVGSLTAVTRQSGGFAVVNDDDLAGGVRRIVQDIDNYYLLGFYPADQDAGTHRLAVNVKRPGLTIRHRSSYVVAPATGSAGRPLSLATLVTSTVAKADLPMRVFAVALPSDSRAAREARVPITLEVSTPPNGAGVDAVFSDKLDYGVFAVDINSGRVVRSASGKAELSIRHRAENGPARYAIMTSLALLPGQYQLRAAARSEKLGVEGAVYLPLDVPDFGRRTLAMTALILGEAAIPVATQPQKLLPFSPTLDRDFSSQATLRVYFEVVPSNGKAAPELLVEFLNTERIPVQSSRRLLEPGLGARVPVDLQLPLAGLPAGPYRLRITTTEGSSAARRETGIVLR
ncbi:MAG TPA: VWA domain-containing protein [Vicinamibacterales bacterium]|nr:VWA domain-containing protein [Vicinamibacterales bacterium]